MQSTVCRGCRRTLEGESNEKDIFNDDLLVKTYDYDGTCNKKWYMKLSSAIELITGQTVTKEEKLPQQLCENCFQNVETYVNFRFQLIRSRDILLSSTEQEIKSTDAKVQLPASTPISKSKENDSVTSLGDSLLQSEMSISSSMSKNSTHNKELFQTASDDLINVDDSSSESLDLSSMHNQDEETNDSLNLKQNDQENNNFNDSDASTSLYDLTKLQEINAKQQEHDLESEIDVCSGEDDDVLELDVQKIKNETVIINSSSESDIEVCDYEPIGKRGNYNTLSPPIRF